MFPPVFTRLVTDEVVVSKTSLRSHLFFGVYCLLDSPCVPWSFFVLFLLEVTKFSDRKTTINNDAVLNRMELTVPVIRIKRILLLTSSHFILLVKKSQYVWSIHRFGPSHDKRDKV